MTVPDTQADPDTDGIWISGSYRRFWVDGIYYDHPGCITRQLFDVIEDRDIADHQCQDAYFDSLDSLNGCWGDVYLFRPGYRDTEAVQYDWQPGGNVFYRASDFQTEAYERKTDAD